MISLRRLKFPATVEDYQSVAHDKRARFVDFAVCPWDQIVTAFDQTGGVGGAGVIELLTVLGERNLEALIAPISKKASELEID